MLEHQHANAQVDGPVAAGSMSASPMVDTPDDRAEAKPYRPPNTWRVCNRTLNQGCTCKGFLTPEVALAAAKRLAGDL